MSGKLLPALLNASAAHKKRTRQVFQNMDLSEGQPKVLAHLYTHEGCTQKQLAEQCHVEPATITALLRNMAAKNLIQKKTLHVSGGKRALGISLTDFGREMAAKAIDVIDEMETISFMGFSEDEKDLLIGFLQRIADNLTAQ
jgi:DNA-binding MarR family transcriptional regulator